MLAKATLVSIGIALLLVGCGGQTTSKTAADRRPAAKWFESTASSDNSPHPVAGNFKPDGTQLSDCRGNRQCYEQAFGNVAYQRGPKAALAVFVQRMGTDATVESGCHRIAHMIGSASLAHYRGNVPKAFAEGSSACWSGYYHGILEHAFARADTTRKLAGIARTVCSGNSIRRTTYLAYQCVHGLGHGLMLQTGYNLPLSLSICDRLGTRWDRTSCTGGVFMENVSAATNSGFGFKSPWLRKNDLVYPCDAVKSRHKLYCYLMVTSRILPANHYDWAATARICARVERGWSATCFQSYGRDADGFTRQNPRRVLSLCRLAGAGQEECIYGAARDMTSNYSNGRRASTLCTLAPAEHRARCFQGIGTILGGLRVTSEDRVAACREVTRTYLAACARGSGATS